METIPGIACLLPGGGQGRRRPGRNLLIQRVIAEGKKGEHPGKLSWRAGKLANRA